MNIIHNKAFRAEIIDGTMMLREVLRGKLSEEELRYVRRRYEVIGDIAIIDVPAEIGYRKMVIANTLTSFQNINVVSGPKPSM